MIGRWARSGACSDAPASRRRGTVRRSRSAAGLDAARSDARPIRVTAPARLNAPGRWAAATGAALVLAAVLALLITTLSHPNGRTPRPAATVVPPQPKTSVQGKFSPQAFAYADGVVTISGYPNNSHTLKSWQDLTPDGGRSWTVGPLGRGTGVRPQKIVFLNASEGWAYDGRLLYTTDGGRTWKPDTHLTALGTVADQWSTLGRSTWFMVTCPGCATRIVSTTGTAGAPTPLGTPVTTPATLSDLLRTDPTHAWVIVTRTASPSARSLAATADGGRTWAGRTISQPRAAPAGSIELHAVSATTAWAIQTDQDGTQALLTTNDSGLSWHAVLTSTNADPILGMAISTAGADIIRVLVTRPTTAGTTFDVETTFDGGTTWHRSSLPIPPTAGR